MTWRGAMSWQYIALLYFYVLLFKLWWYSNHSSSFSHHHQQLSHYGRILKGKRKSLYLSWNGHSMKLLKKNRKCLFWANLEIWKRVFMRWGGLGEVRRRSHVKPGKLKAPAWLSNCKVTQIKIEEGSRWQTHSTEVNVQLEGKTALFLADSADISGR